MPQSRILAVDDDKWIRQMVEVVLAQAGYQVETVADGAEGLRRARSSPPDLIITDVMMPEMDGWTVVRALRSDPRTALIPVIFLTALDAPRYRLQGFQLGADDYLTKPFTFDDLEQRVARALSASRRLVEEVNAMRRTQGEERPVSFRGDLAQFGLSGVLTLVEMEGKSGDLVVQSAERGLGRLALQGGRVVGATLSPTGGGPELKGPEAVFELLGWHDGCCELREGPVDQPDEVQMSTTHLLLEAARRQDEASRAADETVL